MPTLLVFRAFFLPGPLAWGDAPFYNQESLNSLFGEPWAWFNQSVAGLGDVNHLYWIYPISLLYGALYKFLGLQSDVLIRLFFYFPAVLGALITPILLARNLKLSKITQVFTGLVYTFNTSFLLIVDGGQVGVALAYGVFPLSLLYLRKLRENPTFPQLYKTLGVFLLLVAADARIAIICFLAFLLWSVTEAVVKLWEPRWSHFKIFLLFCFSVVGLSLYWLYPAAKLLTNIDMGADKPLEFISLLNSIFLFQPHWPANEFGKVFSVPFYFVGIPLLVFGSLLFKKKSNYVFALCVLIFAFLTKGTAAPLGGAYEFFIEHVPLGAAFRDSSKFFVPTVLFSALLVGVFVDNIFLLINRYSKILGKIVISVAFIYLLSLVYPAISGQMNGVLVGRRVADDYKILNDLIRANSGNFRTVWFPENHPWAYGTFKKPAVDARTLVGARPLANLNTGTQDRFNFLHDPKAIDWFKLFGIKYLVFSGDPRKATLTEEEKYDWDNLLNLVDSIEGLKKLDIASNIPVYEVPNIKSHIFATDKIFIVVGGDKNFLPNQPFLFVEDGKWDPKNLEKISPDSANLIFNNSDQKDLALSFLQKYFATPDEKSKWALRASGDYLKYKYELLIHNINFDDFDYGKGIAFSTKTGEKLYFNLSIPADDTYVIARRQMNATGKMEWQVGEPTEYKKGTQNLTVESSGGKQVVNTAAAIPAKEWEEANKLAQAISTKFRVVDLQNFSSPPWIPVNYNYINPTKYSVTLSEKAHWIVFTDSYNPMWKLSTAQEQFASLPAYSAVNTFYVSGANSGTIFFTGQKVVDQGLYISVGTLVILVLGYIWIRLKG
ncbi:MAG: hypothetical protein A2782_03360 [Candidatus Blackburnbacteria bacterium RIFCSPHIGHO2_01_FULL_43_15b]|uniref:Membrane protein 6-pyruvoyl-tetrahydropterin synthase-related domain-containing protein n=1 Tax=Candidatus Blackburnbacteria bacterium RIFCSPHIGHO2_01_FULL_43_15b TaxID=1797513 RepID=A0A1G1V2H5_9BACT|nr:MAG: hypothetical protein A2782_03360 [Candidatus Blackburnbacteria bacterium RIFCSPHIGHO2_01_FULL_43_15b]